MMRTKQPALDTGAVRADAVRDLSCGYMGFVVAYRLHLRIGCVCLLQSRVEARDSVWSRTSWLAPIFVRGPGTELQAPWSFLSDQGLFCSEVTHVASRQLQDEAGCRTATPDLCGEGGAGV